VKFARKIICFGALAGVLAGCSLNDTPSGSNSVSTDSTVIDSVVDTVAPETVDSTPATVPVTVPETTTTMPEVDLKCVTVLKCQFSYLVGADYSLLKLTGAIVTGANFTNANFTSTVICGLDLTTAIGVTQAQLDSAQMFRAKGNKYCP